MKGYEHVAILGITYNRLSGLVDGWMLKKKMLLISSGDVHVVYND